MKSPFGFMAKDLLLSFCVIFLITFSLFILNSISPNLFPSYYVYIFLAFATLWFFSQINFEIISLFSAHFYITSILLLILTLVIGRVTRGTIRWIPLGSFSLQPAEIVRPFLLVFFANFLTDQKVTIKRVLVALLLLFLPTILIFIQPSLSVAIMTVVGFLGVLLSSNFNKKYLLVGFFGVIIFLPVLWHFMASYQKQRIMTFINPVSDPLGAGYNSLQSVIAVGEGQFFGRGLGHGTQTQLSFLPEKQTDFVFAAIADEFGFVGAALILSATFLILWRLGIFMENSVSPAGRAYISGFFLIYLVQVFIHVGMNMGMLPVTGLPFPLVSAGGSSLLATMIGLGIAIGAYKKS